VDSIEERLERVEAQLAATAQLLDLLLGSGPGQGGPPGPPNGLPGRFGPGGPGGRDGGPPFIGAPFGGGPSGGAPYGGAPYRGAPYGSDPFASGPPEDLERIPAGGSDDVPRPPAELLSWLGTQNFVIADELAEDEPESRRIGWTHLADWLSDQSVDLPASVATAVISTFVAR
jgi:hypothetical protein